MVTDVRAAVYAEIRLDHIRHNVGLIRQHISPKTQLMAIVKANGYGHGAVQTAKAALEAGADRLGVACCMEGRELRHADISVPILVLGTPVPEHMEEACALGLEQTVYTSSQVRCLQAAADKTGKMACVHIKLDTGMGRIGVRTREELDGLLETLNACSNVKVTGVFTHFADADNFGSDSYVQLQVQRFEDALKRIQACGHAPMIHAANSAALWRYPHLQFDCVRAGLVLYGYGAGDDPEDGLLPVMQWKTRIVYVKDLPAGEKVSYGCTYTSETPRRIATLPVGYADGYRRALSGKGYVLVRGQRAPVVGRVCMDQVMIDVTEIEGVAEGDEVVLMGTQVGEELHAGQLARWADTISYEILCGVGKRVERTYVD